MVSVETPVLPEQPSRCESPSVSGPSRQAYRSAVLLATTVFLSAFLLFQVQPLIGKCILPWFGGTAAVWSTCMLFFQLVLFAGYAYAHWLSSRSRALQLAVHGSLIVVAICLLPITPSAAWKPAGHEAPVLRILLLLSMSVGLPYFLLSATGPLLQSWFRKLHPGQSPYRLYALSNIGSLLALITYPFFVEPALTVPAQATGWSILFFLFGGLCIASAVTVWRKRSKRNRPVTVGGNSALSFYDDLDSALRQIDAIAPPTAASPPWSVRTLWFGLAATASTLLLATTNQVCQDVASVPFLWIVPLTLYLLTFILCFDSEHWYRRLTFGWSAAISAGVVSLFLMYGSYVPLLAQGGAYFTALFCACMVCHGELARLKPDPRHLTSFYMTMSAGGAAGGLFVNLAAPQLFPAYWEFHLSLLTSILLLLVVCFRDHKSFLHRGQPAAAWFVLGLGCCWLMVMLGKDAAAAVRDAKYTTRGFFGVLRVMENHLAEPATDANRVRQLVHGRIVHGVQFTDPTRSHQPTAYFHSTSGVGRALAAKQQVGPVRVGIIGLGVGTLASYGRSGDYFRFYEIDPNVIRAARHFFYFLNDTQAKTDIVLGDARLAMERESSQQYDVLVVDAFSGDAIPTHLLTGEALEIYVRHLKADGILAIHYSNLHLNLEPVLRGLSEQGGMAIVSVKSAADESQAIKRANWALLAREPSQLNAEPIAEASRPIGDRRIDWTDHRNNLFEILNY